MKQKKLGRRTEHRKSMLINLVKSLVEHRQIQTTVQRAKSVRPIVEKLITRAKENNLHNMRILLSKVQNCRKTVHKLMEIGEANKVVPGGYTRITRSGFRSNSEPVAIIEIIAR